MLTSKERAILRRKGQTLPAIVTVGQAGVTAAVGGALEQALDDHELVKVRVATDDRDRFKEAVETLARDHAAAVVSRIGRTALLYREREEEEGPGGTESQAKVPKKGAGTRR